VSSYDNEILWFHLDGRFRGGSMAHGPSSLRDAIDQVMMIPQQHISDEASGAMNGTGDHKKVFNYQNMPSDELQYEMANPKFAWFEK
jgi:hypothetical protein